MSLSFIQEISEAIDLPVDLVKTVLALILNLALSPLFRLISSGIYRNLFGLILGIMFLVFLLEEWALYVVLTSLLPYAVLRCLKKNQLVVSVIISFFLLIFVHLHRFIFDYKSWKMDCSVYVMFMVTKVTYFGLYLNNRKSTENQKSYSHLDYLGYCFYFPSVTVGPTYSFTTYLSFIHRASPYQSIPFSIKQMISPLFVGILFAIPTIYFMPTITPTWVLQNQFYLSLNTIGRTLLIIPVGLFYRCKYYTAWYFAQTAANLSGISWDGNGGYTAVVSANCLLQIETNIRIKTEYWNTSIQHWMKDVIYTPILEGTKSAGLATFLTFLGSAFWHGIYWTYYVGFILWGILIHLTKWVYKWSLVIPKSITDSFLVKAVTFLFSTCIFNFIGMFIVILQWDNAVEFYRGVHFWGVYVLGIGFVLSFILKPPSKKEKKAKD